MQCLGVTADSVTGYKPHTNKLSFSLIFLHTPWQERKYPLGVPVLLVGNRCLNAAPHVSQGIAPEQKWEQKRFIKRKNEPIKM